MISYKTIIGVGLILSLHFSIILAAKSKKWGSFSSCCSGKNTEPIPDHILDFEPKLRGTSKTAKIENYQLNFKVNTEKDPILGKKHALIAFDRMTCHKMKVASLTDEVSIMKVKTLPELQTMMMKLVQNYEHVFSQSLDYATNAYNYGLLSWLKFVMSENNAPNKQVENITDRVLSSIPSEKIYQQNFSGQFLSAISYKSNIEMKLENITKWLDLLQFDTVKNKIVDFCLSLGQIEGADVTRFKKEMEYNIGLYEDFLFENRLYQQDFIKFFKTDFMTMFKYVYEAKFLRLVIAYSLADDTKIDLSTSSGEPIRYLSEAMTLFQHAMRNLFSTIGIEGFDHPHKILMIENYTAFMELLEDRRNADEESQIFGNKKIRENYRLKILNLLIEDIVTNYNQKVTNFQGKENQISKNFKIQYSRLIAWLTKYVVKICGDEGKLKSIRDSDTVDKTKMNIEGDKFLSVCTMKKLDDYRETGKI